MSNIKYAKLLEEGVAETLSNSIQYSILCLMTYTPNLKDTCTILSSSYSQGLVHNTQSSLHKWL